MRIGLSSAAFYGMMETEDAAQHLSAYAPDCCEVFLETASEYNSAFGQLAASKLEGLPCVSIHAKGTQFEPDLFGASPRQRWDALQILAGALDAGKALGAKYYVFHGPASPAGRIFPQGIRQLETIFPQMQAQAAARNLEILWENVSWAALQTPEDCRVLLDRLPDLRFVLDIKQCMRAKVSPLAMMAAMGRHIAHVHVLDWQEDGTLCLPGQGCFDFPDFFHRLQDLGYAGDIIL